ncbi:MAG TPA: IPT/TIG domain-containing protein [Solirubrobacterales bacterium]|nr:IPT/TIG domain-containing protein [Solirubrobacterales bacterium]
MTVLVGMAIACVLLTAATAQAAVISIGSVLPEGWTSKKFERTQTLFNTALPEAGSTLASPVTGAIVRWRVQGAVGGPFYLRVLRPNGKGAYEAAGKSAPAVPSGPGLVTFETNLKIQAGDLIGIDPTSENDEIGVKTESGASYASIFPSPFEGTVNAPSKTFTGEEIELSAEVQPVPEIASITPSFGSVTGGTVLTITGKNFTGASSVSFGTTPAAGFSVNSDTEITVTTPPSLRPGKADISVTTFAGENVDTRFDDYVYRACVVPAVKNKPLKRAKSLVRSRGCKVGHVKKVNAPDKKVGKVVKQNPPPGKILAPGSRVRINLGV